MAPRKSSKAAGTAVPTASKPTESKPVSTKTSKPKIKKKTEKSAAAADAGRRITRSMTRAGSVAINAAGEKPANFTGAAATATDVAAPATAIPGLSAASTAPEPKARRLGRTPDALSPLSAYTPSHGHTEHRNKPSSPTLATTDPPQLSSSEEKGEEGEGEGVGKDSTSNPGPNVNAIERSTGPFPPSAPAKPPSRQLKPYRSDRPTRKLTEEQIEAQAELLDRLNASAERLDHEAEQAWRAVQPPDDIDQILALALDADPRHGIEGFEPGTGEIGGEKWACRKREAREEMEAADRESRERMRGWLEYIGGRYGRPRWRKGARKPLDAWIMEAERREQVLEYMEYLEAVVGGLLDD